MTEASTSAPRVIITPTVGRVVWFIPNEHDPIHVAGNTEPHAAIVSHVYNDRLVNLGALDRNGGNHARIRVVLVQDGDEPPLTSNGSGPASYCVWMPFQKGQAAKHDKASAAPTVTPTPTDADLASAIEAVRAEERERAEREKAAAVAEAVAAERRRHEEAEIARMLAEEEAAKSKGGKQKGGANA
ncbi:hypothetical protein [Bradyrhizobium ivorense]|uniref:hypothetical protein n=1 Tax=Bradyrhizobium ivorense TaxID=2511166 RepID=UPI0010B60100|nr:hypothetical protein [Bradyrhizobium ivorense]VIO73882.1 hypothetical protein CI41S_39910 [Bradyrhizobium ivorense]